MVDTELALTDIVCPIINTNTRFTVTGFFVGGVNQNMATRYTIEVTDFCGGRAYFNPDDLMFVMDSKSYREQLKENNGNNASIGNPNIT